MPTTIKDIARHAGVSHTTVSRALNHSLLISPQTTERIQEIAIELGYHPSVAARSLKTNRSQALGVIVSHIADPYFSEVLQGIDDVAQENSYSLFIASAQQDPVRENSIVQTMREHRVDGVILCSPNFTAEQSNQLNSYNIPIVALNNQASEVYRFAIYHDDVDGSRQVCQHLIGLGHNKIAYLGNVASGRTTQERLEGFIQSMKGADLPIRAEYIHQVSGNSAEQGLQGVDYFLSLPNRPTALICYNDLMALGALKGLHRAGLRVPEDMSVTGFDNIMYSDYTQPPLTTIDQPKRFLGAEAARMMFSQLSSDAVSPLRETRIKRLKGMLIIRQSTSPPIKKIKPHDIAIDLN
jgi:LacI family transcriptional regulator/LacI family repressor for deo operon, udp, cdd, tsx, nupC, and nupG